MDERHRDGRGKASRGWMKGIKRVDERHRDGRGKALRGWMKGIKRVDERHLEGKEMPLSKLIQTNALLPPGMSLGFDPEADSILVPVGG